LVATNFIVGRVPRALEQTESAKAFVERGHEVVSRRYRWIDYCAVPEEVERVHIKRAIEITFFYSSVAGGPSPAEPPCGMALRDRRTGWWGRGA
jgi:hypothetical protein